MINFIVTLIKIVYLILRGIYHLIDWFLDLGVRAAEKVCSFALRVLTMFAPVIIYNILDASYNLTPRIVLAIIGAVRSCLSLLSSETLTQLLRL